MARSHDVGDGDFCPVADHGRMLVIPGTQRQQCPHQTHDGVWSDGVKNPPTRSRWSLGHVSFAREVAEYNGQTTKAAVEPSALPTLDITLEV